MGEQDPRDGGMLKGLRILDLSHQYSGALAACLLADLGAEVVAVEDPRGSPIRTMLPKSKGESMWWKVIQRGKRQITLSLSNPEGRRILHQLLPNFDVVVENFRPGTLEKWGIGPKDLESAGFNLIMLRISGFGQTGPLRELPGFGTVAEAMSGFAYLNGFPDGPPVFPSTTLADGVSSTFGALGILSAMYNRMNHGLQGVRVVDVALFESLFRLIPTQVPGFDQLGLVPKRPGNFLGSHGVLRNVWKTSDEVYFCVSGVGEVAIRRILVACGAMELVDRVGIGVMHEEPAAVEAFLGEANDWLTTWAGVRTYAEVSRSLNEAGAVFQRIYSVADIVEDAHYQAREDLIRVPDAELGSVLMQGVMPKFEGQSHPIGWAGKARGADNAEVYGNWLGIGESELSQLRQQGVI